MGEECCNLRRGNRVVIMCCTCAPEHRPQRKVVNLRRAKKGEQSMVRLDRGVILQTCSGELVPRPRLLIGREYVHRPNCPSLTGG